jgi:DNA-binding transcriptional LysR family regulator
MIRIEGIASFVAVVEAGSVSEAARRLRLSKSVVSERLAELEKSLGGLLLHRTTRKLTLTEDGTAFLERAARIVHEIEEATADMAERRGTLAGPLRISAPGTLSVPGQASGNRTDPRSRRSARRRIFGRPRCHHPQRPDRRFPACRLEAGAQPPPADGIAGLSRPPRHACVSRRSR